jgi:hypothetical protein
MVRFRTKSRTQFPLHMFSLISVCLNFLALAILMTWYWLILELPWIP